jgi:hypothetical protein
MMAMLDKKDPFEVKCNKLGKDRLQIINTVKRAQTAHPSRRQQKVNPNNLN